LGIGDWAQSPIPNPQSPIPNPQSPFPNFYEYQYASFNKYNLKIINKIYLKMNKMDIITLFYLIIICIASTEDNKYMLKDLTYGTSNSFDFYNKYESYILKGEVKSPYKSIDFNVYSSINITDIGYLYSNIEYNFPEDMSKDSFKNIKAKYTNYNLHEFAFTASNSLSTKYLYLLISISPFHLSDITIYAKSNYNSNTDSDADSESSTPSYII